MQLLDPAGLTDSAKDQDALWKDRDFVAFGRVCTGGERTEVVRLTLESPNKRLGANAMPARSMHLGELPIPLESLPGYLEQS
jgi:hypothetical protein